jgi:hypothetical protein
VESGKDILIADFMENLDKGEFKIGLNGDCVRVPACRVVGRVVVQFLRTHT